MWNDPIKLLKALVYAMVAFLILGVTLTGQTPGRKVSNFIFCVLCFGGSTLVVKSLRRR